MTLGVLLFKRGTGQKETGDSGAGEATGSKLPTSQFCCGAEYLVLFAMVFGGRGECTWAAL